MDEKQAYCCLSCTNLPPCNAAAGNCVPCCADCEDVSKCQSSAYFYGGNFYKHFKMTATAYSSSRYFLFGEEVPWPGTWEATDFYDSTYDTRNYTPCCKVGQGASKNDTAYFFNNKGTYDCATSNSSSSYEDCDQCEEKPYPPACCDSDWCCRDNISPSQCYVGAALFVYSDYNNPNLECFPEWPYYSNKKKAVFCNNVEQCIPACSNAPATECSEPYPPSEEPPSAYSQLTSNIEFFGNLNLYNSQGQDVGNIIGATFSPCTPTSSWNAPACHFFAP
jgi:hypothetical protein